MSLDNTVNNKFWEELIRLLSLHYLIAQTQHAWILVAYTLYNSNLRFSVGEGQFHNLYSLGVWSNSRKAATPNPTPLVTTSRKIIC
jgi:hypothetical protein